MEEREFMEMFSKAQDYENVIVPDGEMSPKERFERIMAFQRPDRIIDAEFGYWASTLRRWHQEGLPEYVNSNEKADIYFGFDVWSKTIPANTRLNPPFEPEILDDDGVHQIIYDESHIKCEIFSDGSDTIPHYLDFPVKDRASYLPFKERLVGALDGRLPDNLAEIGRRTKDRNYVLIAPGGSTAGYIRNLMGFEGICLGIYDQPDLIQEMLDDVCTVSCAVARAITDHIEVDLVSWWEDIAYRSGPIVTPAFFNQRCGKVYGEVMDIYRQRGTRYGYVDCDGDFRTLMPGWLNNGVNIMFPLEVNAGVHPEHLRRDHAGIRMMGGVDKVALTQGKAAIQQELRRLKPLVEEGGFIPHVDHRVQADVAFDDYRYYLEAKRDIFGIPNQVIA